MIKHENKHCDCGKDKINLRKHLMNTIMKTGTLLAIVTVLVSTCQAEEASYPETIDLANKIPNIFINIREVTTTPAAATLQTTTQVTKTTTSTTTQIPMDNNNFGLHSIFLYWKGK
ncbi:hypothetical protein ACF0H5_020868 [Mactra antiquata]